MNETIRVERELWTAEELADWWGVSASLLRQPAWRQRHGLAAVRVGRLLRFTRAEVAHFMERHAERKNSMETV